MNANPPEARRAAEIKSAAAPMARRINLSRGVPDPQSFPVVELRDMAEIALGKDASPMLQYGPALGYGPLREHIASWLGCQTSNVLIGNGSLEIFGFICEAHLKPGDVVFVERPTYDRALTTLRKHAVQIIGIDVDSNGLDLVAFERAIDIHNPKLVYLIPDFQNPTGVCTDLAARRKIVEWSRAKGFLIVEDGPYRFLRYQGDPIESLYSMAPDRTLHLSSFTKLISPGLRVGFVLGDEARLLQISRVAEGNYITPGYFAQGIVAEWCLQDKLPKQLERLNALYAPRLENCIEAIERHLPGRLIGRPQGGFFASIRLDARITEGALLAAADESGLTLSSGDAFFCSEPGYRFVRLPFCALTPEEFEEGVRRLAQVVDTLTRQATT